MKVSVENIEKREMSLKVEADPDDMDQSLDKAYRSLINKVNVPGFRKGKIPRPIMERYAGAIMMKEATEYLVTDLYSRAIKDQGVDVLGEPELEIVQNTPLIFKARVLLKPEVTLGDFKSINIKKEQVQITQEQIDDYLNSLRERNAVWIPVEKEAKEGDLIGMSFAGTNKELLLDGTKLPQSLLEKLKGTRTGDEREITVDDETKKVFGSESGQSVVGIKVTAIKEKQLPALDDEFARSLGEQIENLDTLMKRIRTNLEVIAEVRAKREFEERVLENLIETSIVEYPDKLLQQEIDRLIEERTHSYGQGQEAVDKYVIDAGKSLEELKAELKPIAEKRLKGSLILGKIAVQEKIEVTRQELNEEIDKIVKSAGQRGAELRRLFNNPVSQRSLYQTILTRKTTDFLLNTVNAGTQERGDENAKQ